MKRAKRLTGLAVVAMATGCLAGEGLPQAEVILGETRVKLTLEDNPTARAFLERLPLTLQFRDFIVPDTVKWMNRLLEPSLTLVKLIMLPQEFVP